jgi:hypothetical protein
MYEIYINPGPRGSTFGVGYVIRDKNFDTRIARPETSAAVIGENDDDLLRLIQLHYHWWGCNFLD